MRKTIVFLALIFCFLPLEAAPLFLVEEVSSNSNDSLLKFENGILTTVGSIGFRDVRGLAYDASSDTLFGVSRFSNKLLVIDRNSGAGTAVSTSSYLPPGSNMNEVSVSLNGSMFGTGHLNNQAGSDTLISVDKTTGVGTAINPGGYGTSLSGFAFDHSDGTLYGTSFNGQLFTIDTALGTTSSVGQITGTNGGVARIAFDQETGTLFGITFNEQLVTIDLNTLAATQVAQFSVSSQIYSLDFISTSSSIPEPSTVALFLLGAIFFFPLQRK